MMILENKESKLCQINNQYNLDDLEESINSLEVKSNSITQSINSFNINNQSNINKSWRIQKSINQWINSVNVFNIKSNLEEPISQINILRIQFHILMSQSQSIIKISSWGSINILRSRNQSIQSKWKILNCWINKPNESQWIIQSI